MDLYAAFIIVISVVNDDLTEYKNIWIKMGHLVTEVCIHKFRIKYVFGTMKKPSNNIGPISYEDHPMAFRTKLMLALCSILLLYEILHQRHSDNGSVGFLCLGVLDMS